MQSQTEIQSPPPQGPPPGRPRSRWRPLIVALVLFLLFLVATSIPIPIFYALEPARPATSRTWSRCRASKHTPPEGSLFLTTVKVDTQVTAADWIRAAIDPGDRLA